MTSDGDGGSRQQTFPAGLLECAHSRCGHMPPVVLTWPRTAQPIVTAMPIFGMAAALRHIPTNGMDACTATNHCQLNFFVCSRTIPKGMLTAARLGSSACEQALPFHRHR